MDAKEKRQLDTELLKMGFPGLQLNGRESADLIQCIAAIVNDWNGAPNRHGEWIDRHKFLRDLLGECDGAQRQAMYDAVIPHLKFKAKPLSHYEALIAERVGNLISKRAAQVTGDAPKPIEIGGNRYAAAPRALATNVVATVTCHRCPKTERFVEPTAVAAMTAARKAGWTREKGINKETCPDCSVAVAATIIRLSNKETLAIYDRRACKLDA